MIIGIEGEIGAGKTLVLTKCILEQYLANRKQKIFANYHLKHIPSQFITFEDLWDMCAQDIELKDCILGLQELHNWMDARTSGSVMNRMLSYFWNQTGKMDVTLYYDTQSFRMIDFRLFDRTDIKIRVERSGDNHYCHFVDMSTGKKGHFIIYGPDVYEFYDTKEKLKARPFSLKEFNKSRKQTHNQIMDNEFKGVLTE